ncbi:sialic acid-binding Ig-like lectin 13 [Aulostomus maculatus]
MMCVYIPPEANANTTIAKLANYVSVENSHPDTTVIVLGDFNQISLSSERLGYHQQVTCPRRGTNTLDHCYTTIALSRGLRWAVFHIEASSWTVQIPSSVKGLPGSCVVIPCSFNYPHTDNTITEFTGIWSESDGHVIYHPVGSKVMKQYRGRTELQGDVRHRNCSLKIDPLKESDRGPFHFRVEMEGYDKYTYKHTTVSVTMMSELTPVTLSVKEAVGGQIMNASCSVSHSCPASPPVFTWSHPGQQLFQSQQSDQGQWEATSTLTFPAAPADNNKVLQCTVTYKGGQKQKTSKTLKVIYAPVDVRVVYKAKVKEGGNVQLKCTSDANPPARSYEWHDDADAQLFRGTHYKLLNVSRHTGPIYCTAINTLGRGTSNPVQLSVSYAPEIKMASSCSLEGDSIKCACIVDSLPPSAVRFLHSDRVLSSSKVERRGSITIVTLEIDSGLSGFVHCVVNNTLGNATAALALPVHNDMKTLWTVIATGAIVIVVTLSIAVLIIRRRSGDAPPSHVGSTNAHKNVEPPRHIPAARKTMGDDKRYHSRNMNKEKAEKFQRVPVMG